MRLTIKIIAICLVAVSLILAACAEKKAGTEIRAQAQGFISLVTYGIGIGLGSVISFAELTVTVGIAPCST